MEHQASESAIRMDRNRGLKKWPANHVMTVILIVRLRGEAGCRLVPRLPRRATTQRPCQ